MIIFDGRAKKYRGVTNYLTHNKYIKLHLNNHVAGVRITTLQSENQHGPKSYTTCQCIKKFKHQNPKKFHIQ